jgi:hypothetical protein
MAGLETVHKIVEKIEVQGGPKAQATFDKLGASADRAAAGLGQTANVAGKQLSFGFTKGGDAAADAGKKIKKSQKESAFATEMSKGSIGRWVKGMTFATLAANLLTKAVEFVIASFKRLISHGWQVNVAIEAAGSRLQGLSMGLMDLEKLDPMERIAVSQRNANATLAEFRDIAMKTATPIANIEQGYARIAPVLAGMGMSQKELIKFTDMAASSAKVYGERTEQAGGIVAKAIFEGVVEGETAFARAFKAQAQVTSKMKPEERIKRVTAVLEKMGAPVSVITKDTAGALDRWRILSDDILQRVTYPIYQKIGSVVADIVGWAEQNKDVLDAIVVDITEWLETFWDIGVATWEALAAYIKVYRMVYRVDERIKLWWERLKLVRQVLSLAAMGIRLIVASIKVAAGDEEGLGKMYTISRAIELKWKEIKKQILNVIQAFAKMAVPDFVVKKIPAVKGFFDSMESIGKSMDVDIKNTAKSLRVMEKRFGTGALTETTRAMKREEMGVGMSKADRDKLFSSIFGKKMKLTQNIGKVEVRQDFRDQDPDRVLIEFTQMLENLGERAIQSTAGGEITALEAGATGG